MVAGHALALGAGSVAERGEGSGAGAFLRDPAYGCGVVDPVFGQRLDSASHIDVASLGERLESPHHDRLGVHAEVSPSGSPRVSQAEPVSAE